MTKIRMFPKDTEFLQGQLGTFLNGNEETKNAVLKDLKKFIEDKIKNSEFGFVLSNEKITIKNNLETKLKEALNNGTIVYMSLNIKNGTVCIDDEPIADIEINNQKGEDIKKEMIKCIKKHITKRMENIDKNISIISSEGKYEKYKRGD